MTLSTPGFTMLRLVVMVATTLALCSSHAQEKPNKTTKLKTWPAPIQVLILGTYHMDNPGKDLANIESDDVTTPKRQKELVALNAQLAKFAPTKIAVEMTPKNDAATVPAYERFTPAELLKDKNEITQIGFRLAHHMKHTAVYAIDEQSETVDYFPFDKVQAFAKANNMESALTAIVGEVQAEAKAASQTQPRMTVTEILREFNEPKKTASDQSFYLRLLNFGQGTDWPGADLNAAWYLRNAKIHAKLLKLAKPGDRIVVIYGAGHNYHLRELVRSTPGFELVEAVKYLR
jgi:hypothetical protein